LVLHHHTADEQLADARHTYRAGDEKARNTSGCVHGNRDLREPGSPAPDQRDTAPSELARKVLAPNPRVRWDKYDRVCRDTQGDQRNPA